MEKSKSPDFTPTPEPQSPDFDAWASLASPAASPDPDLASPESEFRIPGAPAEAPDFTVSETPESDPCVLDRNLERLEIPAGTLTALNTLHENGYEAFLVGGCVRDGLLGKLPKDYDLTTNATPDETTRIFEADGRTVIPSGLEFGTVTVVIPDETGENEGYEVTTYRSDGASSDQRRPDRVEFVSSLLEDLKRRDFTMNAIAATRIANSDDPTKARIDSPDDPTKARIDSPDDPTQTKMQVIDPFNGVKDLEDGLIRAVGDPNERISEDALRMMRAVRFAAQKEMRIEDGLAGAIYAHKAEIQHVSGERIGAEMTKILLSDNPAHGLRNLENLGLLEEIAPELSKMYETEQNNPWHIYNVGEHTEKVLENTPKNLIVRAAALLHDVGKPETKTTDEQKGIDRFIGHAEKSAEIARETLDKFHFRRKDVERVCKLIELHDVDIAPTEEGVCRFIERHPDVSPDVFEDLTALKLADNAGQNPEKVQERIARIKQTSEIYQEIVADRPYRIKDLALNGRDVMSVNETRRGEKVQLEGKAVGLALERILSYVLRHPERNNPEDLTDFLRANLKDLRSRA